MTNELTYPEWYMRICKELTLEKKTLNRLWEVFSNLCVSNGVSPDMLNAVWNEKEKKVPLVVYSDETPLGVSVQFEEFVEGWRTRVFIIGVDLADGESKTVEARFR